MKQQIRFWALVACVAFGGGVLGALTLRWVAPQGSSVVLQSLTPVRAAGLEGAEAQATASTFSTTARVGELPSLGAAAAAGTQSVVFIKTLSNVRRQADDFWSFFDYYGRQGPIASAGSGVILSNTGLIVTNRHVVAQADVIEVNLPNKRVYRAKVVGTDPNTDLALLKIEVSAEEAKTLVPIRLGNSDNVGIGDWVLAVGNPFNLNYTVTAGIVSAKGRNINLLNSAFPIESFIQTDAAINPGNSGGALMNVQGELIGINTAIASRTGNYSGYGFAIPVNLVAKIAKDLSEYGEVQRAFLGLEAVDIDSEVGASLGAADWSGVWVQEVDAEGPAKTAGLKPGDVITALDGRGVDTKAEFLEHLSTYRPGDKVKVGYRRGTTKNEATATLTGADGTVRVAKKAYDSESLGCELVPLGKAERTKLNVNGGFRLQNIRGGIVSRMGLPEGFVIVSVNSAVPTSPTELEKQMSGRSRRLVIEGITPDGQRQYFSYMNY